MTITAAFTGKSGSGKTTAAKALLRVIRKKHPDKTVLLFDNDLTAELAYSFNKDIRKTIYGIRSGKHEYKTPVPEHMTKQEYIEWALEDIIEPIDENTDIIVSWLTGSKDCRCPVTKQLNDALIKLISRYDFVIFDCEYDLKYLQQLVDIPVNVSLIIAAPDEASLSLARRIMDTDSKYCAGGQSGIILNMTDTQNTETQAQLLKKYEISVLGVIPKDSSLKDNGISKDSEKICSAMEQIYYRLNLPQ